MREMLRIKRSVQAMYNTQVNFMSAQMLAVAGGAKAGNPGKIMCISSVPQHIETYLSTRLDSNQHSQLQSLTKF